MPRRSNACSIKSDYPMNNIRMREERMMGKKKEGRMKEK